MVAYLLKRDPTAEPTTPFEKFVRPSSATGVKLARISR